MTTSQTDQLSDLYKLLILFIKLQIKDQGKITENPRVGGPIPSLGTRKIKASRVLREAFFMP